jgi:hypothetical protein
MELFSAQRQTIPDGYYSMCGNIYQYMTKAMLQLLNKVDWRGQPTANGLWQMGRHPMLAKGGRLIIGIALEVYLHNLYVLFL